MGSRVLSDADSPGLASGAATEDKQDDQITALGLLLKETTFVAEDFATEVTLAALLVELALKANLSETQPVSAASLPLPAGASTAALQLADGHAVVPFVARGNQARGTANITTVDTYEDILVAGGAGVFLDVFSIILANQGNQPVLVTIQDEAGSPFEIPIMLAGKASGAVVISQLWEQADANTAWQAKTLTAVTDGVDVTMFAITRS